ncbi:unnamed protein product, partial [Callosobruchus maculatus]
CRRQQHSRFELRHPVPAQTAVPRPAEQQHNLILQARFGDLRSDGASVPSGESDDRDQRESFEMRRRDQGPVPMVANDECHYQGTRMVLQCLQSKHGNKYLLNLQSLVESKSAKVSKALKVLLVILVVILVTLMSAYVYLKKESVKNRLNPLLEAVTRKVQYTTIESQEV